MATSEASKSSRGRPAGDYQVSPARSDDLPPLDPTLALENLSSRRTRSPIVANGTVSALVDQFDRALHDHSSVDAFLELDEQLPPHQQLLRHLHDLSVSRIIVVRSAVKQAGVQPFRGGGCRAVGWAGGPSEASSSSGRPVRTPTGPPPPVRSRSPTEMPGRRPGWSKKAT